MVNLTKAQQGDDVAIKNIYNTFVNLNRLRQIVMTLARHGFGHIIAQAGLDAILGTSGKVKSSLAHDESKKLNTAERLVLGFEELGATFIKFGQVLATRADILPPSYIKAFSRLQDKVEPLPVKAIKAIIERSLKRPVDEVFADFDHTPLASGSIGQTHLATLHSGEQVVVKVKRPGTDARMEEDLSLLSYLAKLAEKHIPELRPTSPVMIVEEFERCLHQETDFVTEAAFTEKFGSQILNQDRICCPKIYWDYVTHDVLVEQYLKGRAITELEEVSTKRRSEIANDLARCFLRQYFIDGFFHSDPHPGNLLLLENGKTGIIDFGQTGQISKDMRRQFVVMLLALARGDVDVVIDICSSIGVMSESSNIREFRSEFSSYIFRFYGLPMERLDMSVAINEGIAIARRNGLILPRDFILLTKSVITLQGVLRQIDSNFRFNEALTPFLTKVLKESVDIKDGLWSSGFYLFRIVSMLKRMPEDIREIMGKLRAGKTRIIFHHEGLEEFSDQLEKASNRITLGLLISAILMGSSIVLSSGPELVQQIEVPFLKGVPLSALIASGGYLVALGLGFWLAWGILRGKRL